MSMTLLYGCAQIETTVRDIEAVRNFLHSLLGAGKFTLVG